jgi:hypothetical protein
MKKKTFLLLCLFVGMATTSAFSQEWTKAQQEMWQVVENIWNSYKTGDLAAYNASLHPKYQGWDNQTPLPYSKIKVMQQLGEMMPSIKFEVIDIEPARIVVTENAAVVDYYYNYTYTRTQGDKKDPVTRKGMAVEFYVKEKGAWLLLGDMGIQQ